MHYKSNSEEPKFSSTIRDGFKEENFRDTLSRDYQELKEFFLNDERKEKLKMMGTIKRFFFSSWWLLKVLFYKLTPARRVLVFIGSVFIIVKWSTPAGESGNNLTVIGGLILLFVLMLELKDKLLAKNELEAGRKIQQALLPEQNPEIPGWDVWLYTKPANEVSGDLIDYIRLDENKFGISIADVAGKGLHAALLMAKLQTIIHTLAPEFTTLTKFGKKLNETFMRESLPNIFASMVYFEVKENSGVIKFLNAGHYPPVGKIGNEIKEMSKGAPALGIIHHSKYKEESVVLKKGDFFVIYSDGLTEAQNQKGDFFLKERLMQIVGSIMDESATAIGEKLISATDRFIGGAKQFDDLSLIVIKKS